MVVPPSGANSCILSCELRNGRLANESMQVASAHRLSLGLIPEAMVMAVGCLELEPCGHASLATRMTKLRLKQAHFYWCWGLLELVGRRRPVAQRQLWSLSWKRCSWMFGSKATGRHVPGRRAATSGLRAGMFGLILQLKKLVGCRCTWSTCSHAKRAYAR